MKGLGNQQDYGMRIYDPRVGRFLSVDPLAKEFPWQSPCIAFDDNPINKIDPDGRAAKPYDEFDKSGKKISNLGGNKIDFRHQDNGDTKIVDRQTGASNLITGGESLIRGYAHRDKGIGWARITYERDQGVGPTKSMIADFDDSKAGAFSSFDNALSTYSSKARKDLLSSDLSRKSVSFDYTEANPIAAQDMWEQIWGRTNVSWYKLGDKLLFLMADSKSMESAGYRVLPSWERGQFKLNGNTYQTYIWTETMTEVKNKTVENANYWHQHYQKMWESPIMKY